MSVARIPEIIAAEIGAQARQVVAAVELLDGGATVPFVARYRKEVTGGLDDTQLRKLDERLTYLRELEARRTAILGEITNQGKLTDDLARSIAGAVTKAELEDIYLPYKPKRRTKAMIAREAGLQGLVDAILADRKADPAQLAAGFLSEGFADAKAALDGARDIIAEGLSEDAGLLGRLRDHMRKEGRLSAKVQPGKEASGAKFSDYFDHNEAFRDAPSHRVLAMLRGRNEDFLTIDLEIDPESPRGESPSERACAAVLAASGSGAGDKYLRDAAAWAWRVKLKTSLTLDLMAELRDAAEAEAIRVFARNLKDLLLAAPGGGKATMGLDPGIRTGVKVAIVDETGKLLATDTVYPFQPKNDLRGAQVAIARLIGNHGVKLIAIGNGTASRETEKMVADLLALLPAGANKPMKVVVSEAGASVYSASELAAREFPTLDVSLRGAVSIARRLQDPLAELVKIEPKSIGVGQYQHDVDQHRLAKQLDAVVEDAVNAVGVDLNTASSALLARVSGVGPGLAESIVAHRDANGPFATRRELLKVARLGPKAFEQAAGFLRIPDGKEPLDASSVHPEAYDLARKIIASCGRDIRALMADGAVLKTLNPAQFVDEKFGLPTVKDILSELEKPGRDPRPEFRTATFTEGVDEISDLKPGMVLEGTVTNVAAFGAFVDIGVHQDGLVHVSQLADKFVSDPHEVVKAGDVVKVTVVEVDVPRKRIGLTMKKDGGASAKSAREERGPGRERAPVKSRAPMNASPQSQGGGNAFADALKGKFGR
ncbi:RNA-binding transcriptional accessory protein [Xinfangfangia sp. D13-10-4-6]|uniref:Tex family protein n=1 Tax=Pseudogemmobacter hezensis TaxID=2737662 RepID=UPI0015521B1A|nr:Tex family protein [Pseudogemmobacter hezensis]NPD13716.1 RNA-binding transcriptional accessory protein [Pseudogemmobacter hezensis]